MKLGSTTFLKLIIGLFGITVLALCISVLPTIINSGEAGAYLPILLGMYLPAIPFFIGLYQGLRLLNNIDKSLVFSPDSVNILRNIKFCAFSISVFYIIGMPYIFMVAQMDDAPGVAFIGFILIFAPLVIATASAIFQQLLQNIVNIKFENDLTV